MKTARHLAIALLVMVSMLSLFVSLHFLTDHSGASLGLPFYLLNGTQMTDYLIPGILFLIIGFIFSLITIMALMKRWKQFPVILMIQGLLIFLFLLAQLVYLGEGFLIQYVFMGVGIILASLGSLLYKQSLNKTSNGSKLAGKQTVKNHHHKHRKH